jgi:CBS domain-containing protein/Zn-dependent protease
MRNWAIPLGQLFGIEFRLHLAFLFPVVYLLSIDPNNGGRIMGILGILFISTLLHQLALAMVANYSRASAKGIILLPLGGIVILHEPSGKDATGGIDLKREFRMAAIGPLVYFALGGIGAVLAWLAGPPGVSLAARPWIHPSNLLRSMVWINLLLGAVNLLPAYPLDGGRFLRAMFARHHDVVTATRRAVSVAHSLSLLAMFLGALMLIENSRPASVWLAMLGFFLFVGAQLEERSVFFQSVLESVRLEEIMLTDFATLSPADTLEDALAKAVHTLQDDFPVVRGTDLVGIISRQAIVEALRGEGNGYVQAVMNKLFEVSPKKESLATAFRKLTARSSTLIPVVDEEHLVGIVTLQNLMHSIGLLAESRKLRNNEQD